jgi:hypothetical protein
VRCRGFHGRLGSIIIIVVVAIQRNAAQNTAAAAASATAATAAINIAAHTRGRASLGRARQDECRRRYPQCDNGANANHWHGVRANIVPIEEVRNVRRRNHIHGRHQHLGHVERGQVSAHAHGRVGRYRIGRPNASIGGPRELCLVPKPTQRRVRGRARAVRNANRNLRRR